MDTKVLILTRYWIEDPSLLHNKLINQLIKEDYQQPHTVMPAASHALSLLV